MRTDVYQRVTDQIVAELEKGVRPWFRPWNAEHAAGRITRPLRANGIPYRGINILMLWAAAVEQGFAAPLWLTYKQAQELGGQVRKGEKGSLVVYANTITRTEQDETTGEDLEREIPFLVFIHSSLLWLKETSHNTAISPETNFTILCRHAAPESLAHRQSQQPARHNPEVGIMGLMPISA